MKTKHTTGPWKSARWNYDHANAPYSALVVSNESFRLCRLDYDDIGDNPYTIPAAEAEANARLIAAAPELLEACRLIARKQYDESVGGTAVKAAREAIAKTTF